MTRPIILVHGGAGRIYEDDRAKAAADGCMRAAESGWAILERGGSAVDAVVAAAMALEDDPHFNAGTGGALTTDGTLEMDALLMEGSRLGAGGVCALRGFQNPITVARAVLEKSEHVLLAAEGAARFARACGFEPVPEALLVTERALTRWRKEKEAGWPRRPGTIGAVAVDRTGHVAAATSTGGISGKLPGRVGDTPLIGCGTYADDRTGAASATGHGESIAKIVMAKHACDRLAAGDDAQAAAESAVAALERVEGEGGIILVSATGGIGIATNTERMPRAYITETDRHAAFEA
ncbi:MAG: isoaspartyl peptidase/L-asparaginase [Deltaproteobacteria bacterium]|nr:MAG: isoaspartyl peptidase/L-asparaginase [Deltaproteobacteria bacterium]